MGGSTEPSGSGKVDGTSHSDESGHEDSLGAEEPPTRESPTDGDSEPAPREPTTAQPAPDPPADPVEPEIEPTVVPPPATPDPAPTPPTPEGDKPPRAPVEEPNWDEVQKTGWAAAEEPPAGDRVRIRGDRLTKDEILDALAAMTLSELVDLRRRFVIVYALNGLRPEYRELSARARRAILDRIIAEEDAHGGLSVERIFDEVVQPGR